MTRRSRTTDPESLRLRLITLLTNFDQSLRDKDLRAQVRGLIPAHHLLRDLGSSLLGDSAVSARDRILAYLRGHVGQIIDGDELMVVAGISEYARRIRELRVQEGWPILSGHTVRDILERTAAGEQPAEDPPPDMGADQYLLQQDVKDRDAAHRWFEANRIRKMDMSIRDKLLAYLMANVGRPVSGEELRYVAGDKGEWARRARELRTEDGWRIVTKFNGNPNLSVGVYVLADDQQSPPHDRHISDVARRVALQRDGYACCFEECGWTQALWTPADTRHLEVHPRSYPAREGGYSPEDLVTYCSLHHDIVNQRARHDRC